MHFFFVRILLLARAWSLRQEGFPMWPLINNVSFQGRLSMENKMSRLNAGKYILCAKKATMTCEAVHSVEGRSCNMAGVRPGQI